MQRQMFAKGGAAFPDMSGDGRVTQKDILMGRGVIPMQEGGMAPMMPPQDQTTMMPPQDPAAMMDPMAGGQAMDPEVVQSLLEQAQSNLDNIDEAEDYATVINSIRGDDAPIEARYAELAELVGPEDAQQTPESVLALVQPAIIMNAVDQGIGGLAAEEMTAPVEGAMAEGIMSTVAPPPPPEMMAAPPAAPGPMMDPAMMGGPPPVNFNQGGLVRRGDNQPVQMMENGGEPGKFLPYLLGDRRFTAGSNTPTLDSMMLQNIAESQNQAAARASLSPAAAAKLPTPELSYDERVLAAAEGAEARYAAAGLGTAAERAAELEEQKNLTQAQMLFDVAQAALAYAGPTQAEIQAGRRLSPAERLAAAVSETKLLPTIGARAQQQLEYKKAAGKEERALKLAAVQRGETQVDEEIAAEQALAIAKAKKGRKTVTVKGQVIDVTDTTKPFVVFGEKDSVLKESNGQIVDFSDPKKPVVVFGREDKDTVNVDGQIIDITDVSKPKVIFGDKKKQTTTVNGQIVDHTDPGNVKVIFGSPNVKTVTLKGQVIDITKPESPKVIFGEKDPTIKIVEGQVVDLTDKNNPVVVFGDPKKDTAMVNGQLIDYTDSDNPRVIYGDKNTKTTTVNGEIIDITDPKNPTVIFGKPDRKTLTVEGQVIDITDPDNVKTIFGEKKRDIRLVKGQLVEVKDNQTIPIFGDRTPEKGTFENMILKSGENILVKKVGETLYDVNGDPIDLSTDRYENAIIVSKDKAFETSRMAGSQAVATEKLRLLNQEMGDSTLANQISKSDDILGVSGGANVSRRTFDALNSARKGVGLYNKFAQIFSEVGGAIVPALRNVAAEEVEAGYYMDAVNVLFRVALANSPRFAEAEQQRLANLAPNTDDFLTNPENAVRKLIGLKRLMNQEYKNNLSVLSRSTNASIRQQAEQQNYAIEGVLKMLETIPDRGFVDETVFESTMDEIMKRRAARGAE